MVELTFKPRQLGCLSCAGKQRAGGYDTGSSPRASLRGSGEGECSEERGEGLGDA